MDAGHVDAADLYRLPPEDFTAARDAATRKAKRAGDAAGAKALGSLRRPSVAAWLVNVLVDRDPDLLDQLLALGPALAEAQLAGSGDALRELGAQRRQLVAAVTDRAIRLAGRAVTAAVRDEVTATLQAALSDPASAAAVRSGRLIRALSYAGFGSVDLTGAVASGPPASPRGGSGRDGDDRRRQAEAAALEAAGALDDAVQACERLAAVVERASERAARADEQLQQARTALTEAERAARDAGNKLAEAQQASESAVQRVREAQQTALQARTALDRLRRGRPSAG